jgi:deazaflavin-dependent oxidoreductase (nitroreductase family)
MTTDLHDFAGEDFCYLATTGRVSGRPHVIEIWFVLNGYTLYMLSEGMDKADWVKNALRLPEVTVKIKETTFTGHARLVNDDVEDTLARQLIAQKYESSDEQDLTEWYNSALPVAVDLIV